MLTKLNNVAVPTDFSTIELKDMVDIIKGADLVPSTKKCNTLASTHHNLVLQHGLLGTEGAHAISSAKKAYTDFKVGLPAVAMSGTFSDRVANDTFIDWSGIFTIDIDGVSGVDAVREKVKALPYTAILFTSPSGLGIKVGIRLDGIKSDVDFKAAFLKLEYHFKHALDIKIDKSCKDIKRLTFLCHDASVYVNYTATTFDLSTVELPVEESIIPKQVEHFEFRMFRCGEIQAALQHITPDADYDVWLSMGMAIHSGCNGHEIGLELWNEWSEAGVKYNDDCNAKWESFSVKPGGVGIGSLFKLARDNGYQGGYSLEAGWLERETEFNLEQFSRRFRLISYEGKMHVVYRLNRRGKVSTVFSTLPDFTIDYEVDKLPVISGGEVKMTPIVDLWRYNPGRKKYSGIEFAPVAGLISTGNTTLPDDHYYNLYTGLAITPKPGKCDLIYDHIHTVLCNGVEEHSEYVLNWMAQMYQRPNIQGHTALVWRSGEGTGKGVIFEKILYKSFGGNATMISNSNQVTRNFNKELCSSVFVYVNEASWGGDKSSVGVLKSLITDSEQSMEAKWKDSVMVDNCSHLIFTSNNDWVVPVGLDDRRFGIFDVNEEVTGNHKYFDTLIHQIDHGGAEAFVYEMLNRDISAFQAKVLPITSSKTKFDQQIKSAEPITHWLFECLHSGELGSGFDFTCEWMTGDIWIPSDPLYNSFIDWCKQTNIKSRLPTKTALTQGLNKLLRCCVKKLKRPVAHQTIDIKSRDAGYSFAPLSACREKFLESAKAQGQCDWD